MEQNFTGLKLLHRLDKLTSGVLMFTKSSENASKIQAQFEKLKMQKMYYARVTGKIKNKNFVVEKPIRCVSRKNCAWDVIQGNQTIEKVGDKTFYKIEAEKNENDQKKEMELKKNANKKVMYWEKSKDSVTSFELIFYDQESNTSLLKCFPKTGRTHQIRVHLKSIGHPIVNDVNYGGIFIGNFFHKFEKEETPNLGIKSHELLKKRSEISDDNATEETFDNKNPHLKYKTEKVNEIWLHSSEYKFDKFVFKAKDPYWIQKDINLLKK